MQLLSKAIHSILTSDADIIEVTGGGNIWHGKIPQNADGSDNPKDIAIYFYVTDIQPYDSKSGPAEVDAHMVRVVIVGKNDSDMYEVAQYVRYALDRVPPGEYAGIYIQGSKFLRAGLDPDADYMLEMQEWQMDFQFRVIDPNIRTPGGPIPSFPGFAGNYSVSEQTWPFSKHLNSALIKWITVELDNSGYQVLPITPSQHKIVKVDFVAYNVTGNRIITATPDITVDADEDEYLIFNNESQYAVITIFYIEEGII